jgi:nucleotide-binding universal stress UspA family protein
VSTPPTAPQRTGPVVIGYDGSPIADRALAEAVGLLAPRAAVVVVVWEAGRAFEAAWPVGEVPVPMMDVRTALELEQEAYESAERTARQGAALARSMGLPAGPLPGGRDPGGRRSATGRIPLLTRCAGHTGALRARNPHVDGRPTLVA